MAVNRSDSGILSLGEHFTQGNGFDAVIITAATTSNDPIELAATISRKKGKIVIVGAVNMDIPREPHFYRKELELKMSCSYGPGRYDVDYETNGLDYPFAYVRWTEQRNMEAFLGLLSKNVVNLKPLTTHVFDIDDAEQAYDIILGKVQTPHIDILLQYKKNERKLFTKIEISDNPVKPEKAGFIGAGSFAQNYLIPHVKSYGIALQCVVTSRGITAKNVGKKFGFNSCSSEADDIINDRSVNTVFIATPHSSHASLVIRCLKANKNVYVEKPLAMNLEELREIINTKKDHDHPLMVGFNRRFAEISKKIKKEFTRTGEPIVVNIRVNAGFIPRDHWIQQPGIGGGRIIGEVCHFIDLMQFFTDSEPVKVFAESIDTPNEKITTSDNIALVVKFKNGSVGNLIYLANGDKGLPKELIEVFGSGKVASINDFKGGTLYKNGKTVKLSSEGKGHKEEIQSYLNSLSNGASTPIPFRSICLTTLTTFKILDCLATGIPQTIELNEI